MPLNAHITVVLYLKDHRIPEPFPLRKFWLHDITCHLVHTEASNIIDASKNIPEVKVPKVKKSRPWIQLSSNTNFLDTRLHIACRKLEM